MAVFDYSHVVFEGSPLPETRRTPPLARRDGATEQAASPEETDFLQWLFPLANLELGCYRLQPLCRRLPACLRALRTSSLTEARAAIERRPELLQPAVNSLLIGVTGFFRDPRVFDYLRDSVIPDMARSESEPSVWSAGCASGAELYSVAALLAEAGLLERSFLLGTDCRRDAVATASAGLIAATHVPEVMSQYITCHSAGRVQISPQLRCQLHWNVADVFSCRDVEIWDLILCRNLAIYLEVAAAADLWRRFTRALRPGGWLVVGKAERPERSLGLIQFGPCIYRRKVA